MALTAPVTLTTALLTTRCLPKENKVVEQVYDIKEAVL